MELSGEHRIPAPRKKVWDALHDADILKECIKGCQSLSFVDDNTMKAKVQAKVGPVKAMFDADVAIVDATEPEGYTLVGEGKGGVAGFAKGSADVALAEDGADTILTYTARATVGGKLAQLGSRLVDTTAKKYAADFFANLSEKLGGTGVTPPEAPVAVSAATIQEGLVETDIAAKATPIDSPHGEEAVERQLEVEAAKGTWGGAFMWGILAFAVVILVLIALQ